MRITGKIHILSCANYNSQVEDKSTASSTQGCLGTGEETVYSLLSDRSAPIQIQTHVQAWYSIKLNSQSTLIIYFLYHT